jgi:hypothetical protein
MGKNSLILDVGSGSNPRGDICIDLPDSGIHRGDKPLSWRESEMILASGEAIPLRDQVIGESLYHHSLEHIPNPLNAIRETRRVCRGRVWIIVPSEFNVGDLSSTVHLYTWTPRTLRNLIRLVYEEVYTGYLGRKGLLGARSWLLRYFPFLNGVLSKLGLHPEIYAVGFPCMKKV